MAPMALGAAAAQSPVPPQSVLGCLGASALAGTSAALPGLLGVPTRNSRIPVGLGVLMGVECLVNQQGIGRAVRAVAVLGAQVAGYGQLNQLATNELVIGVGDATGTVRPISFLTVVPALAAASWFRDLLGTADLSAALPEGMLQNTTIRRLFGPNAGGFAADRTQARVDATQTLGALGVFAEQRAAALQAYADSMQSEVATDGLHSGRGDQLSADVEFTRAVAAAQRLMYRKEVLRATTDAAGSDIEHSPFQSLATLPERGSW